MLSSLEMELSCCIAPAGGAGGAGGNDGCVGICSSGGGVPLLDIVVSLSGGRSSGGGQKSPGGYGVGENGGNDIGESGFSSSILDMSEISGYLICGWSCSSSVRKNRAKE